ncbi:hypothetical protein pEaSNUABM54_00111 [Erwinia phage pEa_SNUABM_54]|nr:hypothetical protein pEaSNUABM54_00111 [Erwinia phage pEa_SNUABM_54]
MALYSDVKQTIIDNVNSLNGSNVVMSQMTFSKPQPTNGKWNGKDISQNTAIRITANAGATWTGTNVFLYNRLDLNDLVTMIGDRIKGPQPDTTAKLASAFNTVYGLNFVPGDIVDQPITYENEVAQVTLKAAPDSLGWIGEWTFFLTKGDDVLDDIVQKTSLDGIVYPVSEDTTVRLGQALVYGADFSDSYDTLKGIAVGAKLDDSLLAIINGKQPYASVANPWVIGDSLAAGPANLTNATVAYNGPAKDRQYANNERYQYVIALTLDTTKTTNVRGEMLLHYSKPLDPSEIG